MAARGLVLALLALTACGDDDTPARADAAPGAADAPLAIIDAAPATVDAGVADVPSSLGQLCATTAPDGGAGSCKGSICCSAGGTTVCTLPEDCPTGAGYKECQHSTECQGSICCHLPSMQFCTKTAACAAYGGTQVP